LRMLTQQFAALLQAIMATIDRFGLRARFLGKHWKAVGRPPSDNRLTRPVGPQSPLADLAENGGNCCGNPQATGSDAARCDAEPILAQQ
jgi:hypothetical protein